EAQASAAPLHFETLSGRLTAEQKEEGWIALNFPSKSVTESGSPPELRHGVDAEPLYVAKYDSDAAFLVEVANKKVLLGIEPDFGFLARSGCGRVIVTC